MKIAYDSLQMVYKPRNEILEDGSLFHLTWRCHDKKWHLLEEWTKRLYYDLLLEGKRRYAIEFHAYQLMENHIHLIGRLSNLKKFSDGFRFIHSLFARRLNKKMTRQGQLVMNRFNSKRIDDESHLLAAMIYGDLNGVRAGRDRQPEDSLWSSYNFYAHGKPDSLITPAPAYADLGTTLLARQEEYKRLVQMMRLTKARCSV